MVDAFDKAFLLMMQWIVGMLSVPVVGAVGLRGVATYSLHETGMHEFAGCGDLRAGKGTVPPGLWRWEGDVGVGDWGAGAGRLRPLPVRDVLPAAVNRRRDRFVDLSPPFRH